MQTYNLTEQEVIFADSIEMNSLVMDYQDLSHEARAFFLILFEELEKCGNSFRYLDEMKRKEALQVIAHLQEKYEGLRNSLIYSLKELNDKIKESDEQQVVVHAMFMNQLTAVHNKLELIHYLEDLKGYLVFND